jgi:hypothetical protein
VPARCRRYCASCGGAEEDGNRRENPQARAKARGISSRMVRAMVQSSHSADSVRDDGSVGRIVGWRGWDGAGSACRCRWPATWIDDELSS